MSMSLNEKNKFVSPRNLLKTVFNGITSFWPFISFKHKFVQNQIDKKTKTKGLHNMMHVYASIFTNEKWQLPMLIQKRLMLQKANV